MSIHVFYFLDQRGLIAVMCGDNVQHYQLAINRSRIAVRWSVVLGFLMLSDLCGHKDYLLTA